MPISKKTLIFLAFMVLMAVGIGWVLQWLFQPTDNPEMNKKLRALQPGGTLPLTNAIGTDAIRACWIIASYSYDENTEAYISKILGAEVKDLPPGLHDGDSRSVYLFFAKAGQQAQYINIQAGWSAHLQREYANWCAPSASIQIAKDQESWFSLQSENKEIYKLPE